MEWASGRGKLDVGHDSIRICSIYHSLENYLQRRLYVVVFFIYLNKPQSDTQQGFSFKMYMDIVTFLLE